jgi:hypothetical protein
VTDCFGRAVITNTDGSIIAVAANDFDLNSKGDSAEFIHINGFLIQMLMSLLEIVLVEVKLATVLVLVVLIYLMMVPQWHLVCTQKIQVHLKK